MTTTIEQLQAEQARIAAKIAAHTKAETIIKAITETNSAIVEGQEGQEASRHFLTTIHEHIQLLFEKVRPVPMQPMQVPVAVVPALPTMPAAVGTVGLAIVNGEKQLPPSPMPGSIPGPITRPPTGPPANQPTGPVPGTIEALRIINEIEELSIDVPDKHQGYAENAVRKAKLFAAEIEKNRGLTVQQTDELKKMRNDMKKLVRKGGR